MSGTDSKRTGAGEGALRANGRGGILILPRTRVLRREFLLPTSKPAELRRLLGYRIPLETPWLASEIAWDWRIVCSEPDGGVLVRVSIVERAAFARYLGDAGLGPRLLGVLVEDDYLALAANSNGAGKAASDEIHIYRHQGRLLAMKMSGGECLRSSGRAIHGANDSAAVIAELIAELLASESGEAKSIGLRFSPGIEITPPAGLVVGAPLTDPLDDDSDADRSSRMKLPGGGWLLRGGSPTQRGLAARSRQGRALFPDAWQRRAAGSKIAMRFLVTLLVIVALAASFTAGAGQLAKRATSERAEIDASRTWLQGELEQVQAAQMLITNVTAWGSRGREILAAWDRIAEIVPRGVSLTALSVQEGGRVVIQGRARSRAAIVSFIEDLRADESQLFAAIALGGLEERGGRQHFNIDAQLGEEAP